MVGSISYSLTNEVSGTSGVVRQIARDFLYNTERSQNCQQPVGCNLQAVNAKILTLFSVILINIIDS